MGLTSLGAMHMHIYVATNNVESTLLLALTHPPQIIHNYSTFNNNNKQQQQQQF